MLHFVWPWMTVDGQSFYTNLSWWIWVVRLRNHSSLIRRKQVSRKKKVVVNECHMGLLPHGKIDKIIESSMASRGSRRNSFLLITPENRSVLPNCYFFPFIIFSMVFLKWFSNGLKRPSFNEKLIFPSPISTRRKKKEAGCKKWGSQRGSFKPLIYRLIYRLFSREHWTWCVILGSQV